MAVSVKSDNRDNKNNKTKQNNAARDQKRRIKSIKKEVSQSWEKLNNPNLFGGGPVLDPSGRIFSLDIIAYGFVAEVFEDEYVHGKLIEAFYKNNEYLKKNSEYLQGKIDLKVK